MTTIVTRAGKGSPITFAEGDANFTNLNTDKLERDGSTPMTGPLSMGGHPVVDASYVRAAGASAPFFGIARSDGIVNEKNWAVVANSPTQLSIRMYNDAWTDSNPILRITRIGYTFGIVYLDGPLVANTIAGTDITATNSGSFGSSGTAWTISEAPNNFLRNPIRSQPASFGKHSANRSTAGPFTLYNEITDQNNDFNAGSGIFTCPVNGLYLVSVTFSGNSSGTSGTVDASIRKNSVVQGLLEFYVHNDSVPTGTTSMTLVIRADAGDTLTASLENISGTGTYATCEAFTVVMLF